MTSCKTECEMWTQFLEYTKKHCSPAAFANWLSPIEVDSWNETSITLKVPNVFVQEYITTNFNKELTSFLPLNAQGEPNIQFIIEKVSKKEPKSSLSFITADKTLRTHENVEEELTGFETSLNDNYRFSTFIEGHANQFVKSAALGVANRPGQSYNPLFIHGIVGIGKTHLLHSIGHYIKDHHKKLKIQYITTESLINQIVDSLRTKSIDRFKRFYRSSIDVLLIDDIQFLQNRPNFEEEFCNTFEALINQNKQIVITSDKPPSQLKLSERMVARLEWGLVGHIGMPDLETRVAILQFKAEQKGLKLNYDIAFHIAERIHNNIRQLEGAINRLNAYSKLLNVPISEDFVDKTLRDMFQLPTREKITVEAILKSVAAIFQVRISDLRSTTRTKEIAIPRQIAMFLAKELIDESSLVALGAAFGKTHSTILHACKTIEERLAKNETLKRQLDMIRRHLLAGNSTI